MANDHDVSTLSIILVYFIIIVPNLSHILPFFPQRSPALAYHLLKLHSFEAPASTNWKMPYSCMSSSASQADNSFFEVKAKAPKPGERLHQLVVDRIVPHPDRQLQVMD